MTSLAPQPLPPPPGVGRIISHGSLILLFGYQLSVVLYLYSASSRLLLCCKSAPDSSTAKNNSFKARVECVKVNPWEQSHCQWETIPNRGANHRECTSLAS